MDQLNDERWPPPSCKEAATVAPLTHRAGAGVPSLVSPSTPRCHTTLLGKLPETFHRSKPPARCFWRPDLCECCSRTKYDTSDSILSEYGGEQAKHAVDWYVSLKRLSEPTKGSNASFLEGTHGRSQGLADFVNAFACLAWGLDPWQAVVRPSHAIAAVAHV